MKSDGEFIIHLKFADDVILLVFSFEELQEMLQELNKESKLVGLKMNLSRTKIIPLLFFHRKSLLTWMR